MEAVAAATTAGWGRRWAGHAALGALLISGTLALGLGASVLAGYRPLIVRSGSMAPSIETGDLVLAKFVRPSEVSVGEVVTFRDPSRSQELVTHRVVAIERQGSSVSFVTKGDANTGVERWSVDAVGTVGRVAFRVPKAGYLVAWVGIPAVRLGLLGVAVVVLGAVALRRIWGR